ncbi:M50 family metallopeptidase [Alkalinema pantanalense CENA528]|uniref:M50 family metallopeptidase n=1 Tax=Alkalinema pantanalense TaxID=1620705 RepID=UPI003D6E7A40
MIIRDQPANYHNEPIITMSKAEISINHHRLKIASNLENWLWIPAIAGFVFILFQSERWGPLIWVLGNVLLLQVMIVLMTLPHELGHAITARLVGMQVSKIVLGTGKARWTFQFLGFLWEVKTILAGGITLLSTKSISWYRSRLFIVILAGPLANALMILGLMQLPQNLVLHPIANTLLFPGIVFYIANAVIVIGNLFPIYTKIDDVKVPTDGLQLLTIPFLSQRDVVQRVALAYVAEGQEWERRGHSQQAIECFIQATAKDSQCVAAYQSLGTAYQTLGDYSKAIQYCNQAIDLDSQNALSYFIRGMTYTFWRRTDPQYLDHALNDFTQAIQINPNLDAFYFMRAAISSYVGNLTQAIDDFTQVIRLNPSANAYYNRGAVQYQSRNYSAALADFDHAIKLDQANLPAYYGRGNAKYDLQDTNGAFADFKQAKHLSHAIHSGSSGSTPTEIDPNDEHGFYLRGVALLRLGDRASGLKDLQTAENLCIEHGNPQLLQTVQELMQQASD